MSGSLLRISPLRGVTPDFDQLEQVTIRHSLEQFGSYVNVTDVMMASNDPLVQIITERRLNSAGNPRFPQLQSS